MSNIATSLVLPIQQLESRGAVVGKIGLRHLLDTNAQRQYLQSCLGRTVADTGLLAKPRILESSIRGAGVFHRNKRWRDQIKQMELILQEPARRPLPGRAH